MIFKALMLCELYNLSDKQFEYQVGDRLSFIRFLGLDDPVPDSTTVWQYREQLVQTEVVDELFGAFDGYLKAQGWLAMGGQLIDASHVPVPKQRNARDEDIPIARHKVRDAAIRAGETPEEWANTPAKNRQKDTDTRRTEEYAESHYVYKNHDNVDRQHKLIQCYPVTGASTFDSQVIDDILDANNTPSDLWANSAYWLAVELCQIWRGQPSPTLSTSR